MYGRMGMGYGAGMYGAGMMGGAYSGAMGMHSMNGQQQQPTEAQQQQFDFR